MWSSYFIPLLLPINNMAATKKRQRRGQKRDKLELAIATVLNASPVQKAKYRRALTVLLLRLQREQSDTIHPASLVGSIGGQPNDLLSDDKSEESGAEHESTIDLYLKLAIEESEIAKFFQEGRHLSCLEQVSTTEDRRVQDFAECEGRDQPEQRARFRRLLAILSLATEYKNWELTQLNANRKLTEIAISAFVRKHPESFPDQETAKRAIYSGRRYREQDLKFPGTSAIITFAYREFDQVGPLERLRKQFELEELKFIPKLGLQILPYPE
jgi:hypothetical protein